MDQIRIDNVRFFARHGVFGFEREQGQEFVISAVLCLGVLSGCGSSFSATDLVKGNLDLIYLNQYTDTYLRQHRTKGKM